MRALFLDIWFVNVPIPHLALKSSKSVRGRVIWYRVGRLCDIFGVGQSAFSLAGNRYSLRRKHRAVALNR